MNNKQTLFIVAIATLLTSCVGPSRLLNLPFDATGRAINSPFAERDPQISGRYLVFTSDRGRSQDIYLYDLTNQQLIDLPGINALDAIASHPSISQDGRYIVFVAHRQGESNIYLYNRETRQLRNLTTNLRAEVRNPVISADGRRIAFQTSSRGQWDIRVYDRAGKPLKLPN